MKFFFCETCGKRITDEDIQQGVGADKQLKGVYCQTCAVGVKTSELSAITQLEIDKAKATQSARLAMAEPASKRSSRFNLIALKHEDHGVTTGRLKSVGAKPHKESSQNLVIGSIAGAVMLVVTGILLITAGPSSKTASARNEPQFEPQKYVAPVGPVTSPALTSIAPATHATNQGPSAPATRENHKPSVTALPATTATKLPGAAEKPAQFQAIEAPVTPVEPIAAIAPTPSMPDPPKVVPAKVAVKPLDKIKETPKTTPPAIAKLPPGPTADQVRFAYAAFQEEFLTLLRADNAKGAAERLATAEVEPLLAAMQKELAQDRAALKWLSEIDAAADEGVAKLTEIDDFELRLTRGESIRVGKSTGHIVEKAEDGSFQIRSKGVNVPLPAASFQRETQFRLAALALNADGAGLVRRAFMQLLPESGKVALDDARAGLKKAADAGAPADEAECLQRWINACETVERESAAKAAWAEIARLAETKQWKPLRSALTAFTIASGKTQTGLTHEKESLELASQADKALLALEPLEFNFLKEENTALFEKTFSALVSSSMAKAHEPGKWIVRKNKDVKGGTPMILGIQAPRVNYGKDFEISMRVNMRLTAADADANTHATAASMQLRFMEPGEKYTAKIDGVRFTLNLSTLSGGSLGCSFLFHGQDFKYKDTFGKGGVFDSLKKNGIYLANALKSNRKPVSADGEYVIHFTVQNGHVRATLNDVEVEDNDLSPSAQTLIEKSPLTLMFSVREDASEIWLEEFSYRNLEKK
jgi:hypothetical protein